MAFRLGHQISRNLNKNLIFQNSSASNARRYRSLSRGNDCEVEKVEDALPTGTETTQRKCLRARSHTKFSTPIASTRRELSTSSSSESPQQSAHEVEPIPSTMSSLKNNRKQSGNYSLQPKHLPPMATSSIHFDKQFIPAVQQQYDNRLDEVQRQASVKYEQAIKTFNVISSRTAAAQPKNVGYRYELDAAKPKVEKGTHAYNIIAAIKSREQSIAAQVPQLQPKNMKPYGDVLGKQWCTPLAERIKHKPLSMSHLNDAIIRSPYQHSPSIDAVPTSEHVAFSESNQRSSVEYAPGGTQFTSQPINSSQYPAFSRSGISSSKQIEQCTRKTYSTIQKANMSGYCSDSEPTLLLPGKVGNTDIDTKNTNESTSLQLYRATEKPVENNIAPKKREMISTLMEEKRNFTSQKYNLKNNESLKNVMSKNQPSMGSALLERIKKISKENLFAVRNAMNSSINANEVLDNTPPQNDKQIRETEPIKVTVGPRLKLQSTVSWTLEEYSEREKSLIPQSGEKFTVPWLSWGDRVKMQKEEEGKNANTGNLNLIPKSIASSAVKDKSRSVNERQTRRFSTFRFLEKEVEMEKILAHPVHKDFIIGIDLPENKHLLTKNTIPYVNVRSYGTGYGSGTSTGLPDDCLCDPPPRKIPPESVAYCHIEKFPKTHVNPDCKKKCQSEYTVMVKLRRLPKIHIPDPCRDCPEPCDDAVRADGCIKVPRKCLPKLIPKPCPPIPPPCMTDVPLRRLQPRPVIPFRPCPPPPCIDPRADDGLKPVRKTLPKLVPKMCGRCEEIIMTSPPLVRLIPRDVYPPPPCKPPMCPEPPITRADEGMRVCPKQLPKLIAPTCPRICPEELVDSPPLKRLKCACVYTERICPCVPTYRNPCCPPPSRSDDLCGYKVPKKHLPTMLLPERYNEVSTSEFNRMKSRHYCTHSKDTMCCCANKKIRLVVEDFKNSQFGEEKKLATVECERQEQPDNSQNASVQLIRKPIGDVKRSTIIPIHLLKEGYTGRYNGLPNESKTFGSAESRPSALSQRTSKDLSAITPEYLGPFSRPNKPNIHYRTYATQSLRVYTTGSSSIFKKIKENRKRCAPVRYHNDDSDSKECPKFGKCSIKKPPCCGPNPRGFDCSIKAPYPPCTAQQAPYPSFSECQKECCKRPRNECTEQDRIFERQKQTGQLDICNILKTPPRDFRHGAPKKDDPGCKGAASCKEYSTLALAHQAKIFNNILPPPTKTDSSVKRNNSSQLTKVSSSTKATLVGSNDHKLQRIAYSVFSSDLQKLSDKEFKNFFLSASFLAPPKTYSETNCDDTTSYLADAVRRYCSTLTLPQLVNITKKSCGNNASIRFSDSILGHKNIRSYSTLSQTRMYSTDNNCAKEPCKIDPEGCCLPKARESCNIKAPYPPCASIEAPYPSFSDCNKGFPRLPICECSEQEKVFIKMKNSGMFDMSPKKRNNNNNCGLKLRKCEPPHKIPCDREFSTCVDKFFADPNDEIEFDTESCLSKEETEKTDYKPEIVPRICDVSMTEKSIFPRCFQHSAILSSSSQANLCQVSYRHFSSNKNPKYNKYALKRDDVETCDSSSRHPCSPVSTPYSCYSDHQKELTKPINQSAERDRIFERLRSNGAYDMKNLQKAKKHATFTNPKIKFDTNAQRRMFSSYSKNWGHSQPSFFNETTDDAIRDLEGEELAKKVLTTVKDGMDAIALSANEVEAQEAYYQMYENLVKLCQQEEVSKKTPSISNIKSNNIEPIFSRDVFFDKCLNNNAAQKQMTSDAIKNIFTSPFPNPTTSTTIYEETEKNKTESLQKELDKLLDHYKTQKM